MLIGKKEFGRIAVSVGIANRTEVKIYFNEFPRDFYDDYEDIVSLWRFVARMGKMKHVRKIQRETGTFVRTMSAPGTKLREVSG